MKYIKIWFYLCIGVFSFLNLKAQNFKSNKVNTFSNFPSNANPAEIGKRLSEHFLEKPHSTFGAFRESPATEITYPDACAWYGALSFAKSTNDKNLSKRLIDRAALLLNE